MTLQITLTINNDAMRLIVSETLDAAETLVTHNLDVRLGLGITLIALRVSEAVKKTNGDLNAETINFTATVNDLSTLKDIAYTRAMTFAETSDAETIMHSLKIADAIEELSRASVEALQTVREVGNNESDTPRRDNNARRTARRAAKRYKRS